MLARSKQILEEKAEAARASIASSSSDGSTSYALRKKRGKEDIPEVFSQLRLSYFKFNDELLLNVVL